MSWVHYHVLGTSTMSWVHRPCLGYISQNVSHDIKNVLQDMYPRYVNEHVCLGYIDHVLGTSTMSWVHRPCLGQQYDIVGTFSISWAHGLISWVHVLMSWVHLTYRGYISYDVVNTCHPRHKSCSPRHDQCAPRHVPKIWCTSNTSWVTIWYRGHI